MNITVILCTYNRCQSLAQALESIAVQSLPDSIQWEVLVVDNNSKDKTREVVEGVCYRYPGRFRYLFEPHQGKSYALNAGIQEARGDVLAFTDDDVTVEPTWLRDLTAALHDGQWGGSGGRTLPDRMFSPPRWLSLHDRFALGPLAVFDLGPVAGELTETPFGNNMAFRKQMFQKYGSFRTDLGPRPGSEIRSEDTEFGRRLLDAGERLRYEPAAIVYHAIPKSRVQKRYFLAWWFDKARADIQELGTEPATKLYVAGIPVYLFRRFAVWTLRWTVSISTSQKFSNKLNVWRVAGAILGCYQLAHRENPSNHKSIAHRVQL